MFADALADSRQMIRKTHRFFGVLCVFFFLIGCTLKLCLPGAQTELAELVHLRRPQGLRSGRGAWEKFDCLGSQKQRY